MNDTEKPARFNEEAVWRLAIKHEAAAAPRIASAALSYQPPTFTRADHEQAAELLKETVTAFTDARERMLGQIAELRAALGIRQDEKAAIERTAPSLLAVVPCSKTPNPPNDDQEYR